MAKTTVNELIYIYILALSYLQWGKDGIKV